MIATISVVVIGAFCVIAATYLLFTCEVRNEVL